MANLARCGACRRDAGKRFFEPGPYLFLVYYVQCTYCEHRTADYKSIGAAVRRWNTRRGEHG